VLQNLLRFIPDLKTCLLIGGTPMPRQLKTLKSKPRIIIATPGRLVDHLRRGTVSLSTNEILVLDEADRMLEIGFAPQLNEILRFLPKARQTLFFSATFPPDIQRLASKYLKDPVRVTVGQVSQPADHIDQAVRQVNQSAKNQVLQEELNSREGSVLIFARTKHRTDRVARFLSDLGHDVTRLHGNRSQSQRRQALDGFKQGKIRVLVATDLAARGLDVPHVAHVINYDLPQVPEDYIHRIGRTARAGAHGKALSLVTPEDKQTWADIARLLAKSQTSKTAL
jgi:superfamily II DNA/RNA helicase